LSSLVVIFDIGMTYPGHRKIGTISTKPPRVVFLYVNITNFKKCSVTKKNVL